MRLEPYVIFNGNCREAVEFYAKVLRGKLEIHTYGESPGSDEVPPERRNLVMHAQLSAGDAVLMASDTHDPAHYHKPQGVFVSIGVADFGEAERIYNALSQKAESIAMPLQKTFWTPGFAMFTDRFGVLWMINVVTAS